MNSHLFARKNVAKLFLPVAATCGLVLSSHATILVDDTWADGDRTSSGADGSGIDSPWFSSSGAALVATTGSMTATPASASSLTFWTYFTASGSPVSLAVGDSLKVTLNFSITGPGPQTTSRTLPFGLFDTTGGTRRTSDGGSPTGNNVIGYRQNLNFGSTFGAANALQTQARTSTTDANLISSSGDYTTIGVNGGGNAVGATGFSASTSYTLTYEVTRTSSTTEDITTIINGDNLNGTGSISQTVTDSTTYQDSTFDTFLIRPSTGASTATSFTFTEFKVEDLTATVPEPSTYALALLGSVMFAGWRRFRR